MADPRFVLAILLLPVAGSRIAAVLPTRGRDLASTLAGVVALAGCAILIAYYPHVADGAVLRYELPWLPTLGLNLTLRLDGFTWLFATLVLGIGALVILYARYYMSAEDPVPRFFAFLQAFLGAMQIGRASCRERVWQYV